MTTKAVLFDLDETLMYEETSNQQSFQVACQLAAERYPVTADQIYQALTQKSDALWQAGPFFQFLDSLGTAYWEGLWGQFSGNWPNFNQIRPWIEDFRAQSWQQALQSLDIDDHALADYMAETFIQDRAHRHTAFDHAHQLLADLSKKYKLALITNGVPDIQWCKINALNFAPYFQAVLISGELGIGKPDPKIFNLALEKLGTSASNAVMVGNSLSRDIAGAHNAQIRSILIDTTDPEAHTDITPDAVISQLDQLPPLL
ncbi:MAG: HAD family hydrolase [Sedimentisphaerales bacterium]|nr:HAD family hydrolase [Sedimentisphaerales bacterium]